MLDQISSIFCDNRSHRSGALYAGAWRAEAEYLQTNLVSDIAGLATITDAHLQNPWGFSHTATSEQ